MEDSKAPDPTLPPDRIIDRNIATRGLSESFSANISRKCTPSKVRPGPTVNVLVDPLEKPEGNGSLELESKAPGESNKSSRLGDTGDKQFESQKEAPKRPVGPSAPPHPFAEDSLTLMEYKAFFNNRPLGRCLDDFEEAQTKKKSNSTSYPKPTESMEKSLQELEGAETGPPFTRDPAEVKAF